MNRKSNKKLVKRRKTSTSFSSAFKSAKQKGLKEFTWNGKRYNTKEKDSQSTSNSSNTYKGVNYANNKPKVREYNGTTIGNDGKYYHEKNLTLQQKMDNLVAMNAFGLNFANINPNVDPGSQAYHFISTNPQVAEYYGLDDVFQYTPRSSKSNSSKSTQNTRRTSTQNTQPAMPSVIISSAPLSRETLTSPGTYYDFTYVPTLPY